MIQPWQTDPAVLLTLYLPGALLVATLLYHSVCLVPWPSSVHDLFDSLTFPFRDFITFEDFTEPPGSPLKPAKWKTRILTIGTSLECAVHVGTLIYLVVIGRRGLDLGVSLVGVAVWTYATCALLRRAPTTPPYLLLAFYTCYAVSAAIDLYVNDYWSTRDGLSGLILLLPQAIIYVTLVWFAGDLPLLATLTGPSVAEINEKPSGTKTSPEDRVTLWQWMSFSFVQPLLNLSGTQTINDEDVWDLSAFFKHKNLFNAYLRYRSRYPSHSLLRFLVVSNSLDLFIDLLTEMWSTIVGFANPYALQRILAGLAEQTPEGKQQAYHWTWVVFAANLSFAQMDVFQRWHTRRCYERTRGQLFCALHYKALQRRDLSGKATQKGSEEEDSADLGRVVNLMQGDCYAVAQRFWDFSAVFASPVRLAIALYFLWQVLGWSCLIGIAVVLVTYTLNLPLAKYNIHVTRQSWKAKDSRSSAVTDLFSNIRFLKYFGWESRWSSKARHARETELEWRVRNNIVDTVTTFLWSRIPAVTTLLCFWSYTYLEGERLTVAKAFTAMALFGSLQGPLTQLPGEIFALLHAYVSMQRIQKFLAEDEVPNWATSLQKHDPAEHAGVTGFTHATFAWDTTSAARFTLGPLNLAFPHGKLSLVCGATSSGKTALLNSLLGETHCMSGSVCLDKLNHLVAYCAQHPWLEQKSIKDNIIFGSSRGFDHGRYNAVIEACALAKDLALLDAGDMTEIGEKGITLSGGQRARLAMARALYSDATTVLLDDPLAAVDMHTAAHLLEHALGGELAHGRTIVLVTHHVRLCLPVASYVVELGDGQVLRAGTPVDLDHLGLLKEIVESEDQPINDDKHTMHPEDDDVPHVDHSRAPTGGKLVDEEAKAEGRVSLRTYWTYAKACGIGAWTGTILLMIAMRVLATLQQLFIAKWTEAYEEKTTGTPLGLSVRSPLSTPLDRLPPPAENVRPWLWVFLLIIATQSLSELAYLVLGYWASLRASRKLFLQMLLNLARAPTRFFDKTPLGRILNRFTSDIGTVDGALQNSARRVLQETFNFTSNIIVICAVVPSFLPWAVVIFWLYARLAPSYIRTSRDLRRLESISLSPAFAGFDELLRGIVHVRAFGMEDRFQDTFYQKVDKFQTFDHVYWLVSNWLSYRYDLLGSVVVFMTGIFALWTGVSDGFAAIIFVQAQTFADATRLVVRVGAQLELDFNSVERIVEYLDVPQEKAAIVEDRRPPAWWPSTNGSVVVENLVVKYAPELPPVLQNLSFTINPSEKVGIVGRTGSGKSTTALSILRMVEATQGSITIDGINIADIGLEDLRSRITLVSQDVSLFSGSIRSNLDPFDEHTDAECYDVLEASHLKPLLDRSLASDHVGNGSALDVQITANSMSAGEKQLLALARAILRRTNIVILDEATAQVDQDLDDKIQQTIRKDLSHATVIAIAHRLKTVLDYDRVLVLDQGQIREFDTPLKLLRRPGSLFGELCRKSADWPVLRAMAERRSE